MVRTQNLELAVGAFVLAALAALAFLIIKVGSFTYYDKARTYKLYANFSNIGGLKEQAKITISGVTIGRVNTIGLYQNEYGEFYAQVEFAIDNQYKIPTDSVAKILTAGLLGDNYIGIIPGQEEIALKPGANITNTHQAVLLEDLIAKFAIAK